MGLNEILFYIWWIFTITVLFFILITIFECFIPKMGDLISKFKNYLKGGIL